MLENEIEVVEMEDIGRGRDAAIGLYKGSPGGGANLKFHRIENSNKSYKVHTHFST